MTQRHAMRRGVTPRPSEKDLRLLRRMVERASRLGGDPMREASSAVIAAEKAGKAILPVGHQHKDSPFILLRNRVLPFLTLGPVDRLAAGPELARLAEDCAGVLAQPAPSPRERKDIDG